VGVAVMLIYGTNLLSYHELIVAGEVIMSAPSRARRVISDQILALDLTALVHQAEDEENLRSILSNAASQFGFLGMELSGHDLGNDPMSDRILSANWAWRLDYPIRIMRDNDSTSYVLSIWCSPEQSTRPYGAERVARILGPALQRWFESRLTGEPVDRLRQTSRSTARRRGRLRIQ
jgi:hypothetical protein